MAELLKAAKEGDERMIYELVDQGWDANFIDKQGRNALMYASLNNHAGCVQALLDESNVDQPDKDGTTALMLASKAGHAECVRILIEGGATVDKTDNKGANALTMAVVKGHSDCASVLRESGAVVDEIK